MATAAARIIRSAFSQRRVKRIDRDEGEEGTGGGVRENEREEERGWKSVAKKGDSERVCLISVDFMLLMSRIRFMRLRVHASITRNKVPERKRNVRFSIATKISERGNHLSPLRAGYIIE